MKITKLIVAVALLAGLIQACKPTEAGYKAAYDMALQKRQAEQEDAALYGMTMQQGGPQWRKVGATDSVLFLQQPLASLDGDSMPLKIINVAVAAYKMPTNAKAHSERLRVDGLNSRVLKNNDSYYYVIAAQFDSISPTVEFISEFVRKHPKNVYSGLPGKPIVTAPSGKRVK